MNRAIWLCVSLATIPALLAGCAGHRTVVLDNDGFVPGRRAADTSQHCFAEPPSRVAAAPARKHPWLAVASDRELVVLDVSQRKELLRVPARGWQVVSLAFSPDDQLLVSVEAPLTDGKKLRVSVLPIDQKAKRRSFEVALGSVHPQSVWVSPEGRLWLYGRALETGWGWYAVGIDRDGRDLKAVAPGGDFVHSQIPAAIDKQGAIGFITHDSKAEKARWIVRAVAGESVGAVNDTLSVAVSTKGWVGQGPVLLGREQHPSFTIYRRRELPMRFLVRTDFGNEKPSFPAIFADGKWCVIRDSSGGGADAWLVDLSSPRPITLFSGYRCLTWLSSVSQLWAIDAETGEAVQLETGTIDRVTPKGR